jgi:K+-sensing histidine kinase KdpD
MKRKPIKLSSDLYFHSLFAILSVAVITVPMVLIGRATLGEAVIALLFLIPVAWSAARWGQIPGICAALAAALAFDFFFIPPFHTFTVGNLEGWLVLGIFLLVATVVVGRIQAGLDKAHQSEHDALFMYELSSVLSGLRTQEAVVHALAVHLQRMFFAAQVEVQVQGDEKYVPAFAREPGDRKLQGTPDRVLPILIGPGLVGEVRIWQGDGWLPPDDSRLLQNLMTQASLALERARLAETEAGLVMKVVPN